MKIIKISENENKFFGFFVFVDSDLFSGREIKEPTYTTCKDKLDKAVKRHYKNVHQSKYIIKTPIEIDVLELHGSIGVKGFGKLKFNFWNLLLKLNLLYR